MKVARVRPLIVMLVCALSVGGVVTGASAASSAPARPAPASAPYRATVVEAHPVTATGRKKLVDREKSVSRFPAVWRARVRDALAAGARPSGSTPGPLVDGSPQSPLPAVGLPGELIWGVTWLHSVSGGPPTPLTLTVLRTADNAVVLTRTVSSWTTVNGYFVQNPMKSPLFDYPDQVACLAGFNCVWYLLGAPFVAGVQYKVTISQPNGTVTSQSWPARQYSSVPASLTGSCTCAYQQHRGDPVNTGTGALTETGTDATLPGAGTTFALERHYRSDTDRVGLLGRGWSTGFEASLVAGTNAQTLVDADGARIVFTRNADGTYTAPKPVRYRLTAAGSTFTVTAPDRTARRFDATGRLTAILDAGGVGLTLTYGAAGLAGVTDAAGRVVTMTLTGGRLTKATLPDGRFVQYGYTGTLLSSVRGLNAGTTTYGYDAGNRLSTVRDPRLNTATTTYDATSGRVTRQVDSAGKVTAFGWDATRQIATMTDPNGGVWTDAYAGGALLSHSDPLGNATTRSYDPDLNVISETDGEFRSTWMTYDTRGNLTGRTNAGGSTESWTYDAADNISSHTNGRGVRTDYTYDTSNRLTKVVTPLGTSTLTYTAKGQLATTVTPAGRTTTHTYDAAGNVTAQTTQSGAKTTFGYDGAGRATSTTDPRGNVTGATPTAYTTTFSYTDDDLPRTSTDPLGRVTTYGYDVNGNRTSTRDVAGGTSTQAYDALNRPTTATNQLGKQTTTGYDGNGNVVSQTDELGARTTFSYDAANRRASMTSSRGNLAGAPAGSYTTTYGYDRVGNQTSVTDPTGAVTRTTYDGLNRPRVVTDPLGRTTTTVYDGNGNPTSVTDRTGAKTVNAFDQVDRLQTVTDPLGKITTYGYDADGNRTSATTPLGNRTTWTYDGDGRQATMVDPRGNVAGGTPAQYTTQYRYDPAGNRTSVIDPLGHTTTTEYDALDNATSATDPLGRKTTRGYDALGRVTSARDPAGAQTGFAFDAVGNLTRRTDAKGHVTTYDYDAAGQLKKITDPLNRARSFGYDVDGNRTTSVNARGTTATRTVNPRGEVTAVAYSDATRPLAYAYDKNGNPTSVTDATGTRALTYDNEERLLTVGVPGATTRFSYAYNANGDITTRTFPDGRATVYTYDADRRRVSHTVGGNQIVFGWDPAGNQVTTKYPATNGYTEAHTFDRAGRLTKVDNTNPTSGAVLASWTLTLDNAGQPTRIDAARAGLAAGSQNYTYDPAGRLLTGCTPSVTTATGCPAGSAITYTYDAVGNRATSVAGGVTTSYAYDAADQLTSTAAGAATTNYSYDADGNQTGDGTRTYTYDAGNHLTGITSGATVTTFVNDADGNRVTVNQNGALFRTQLWDVNGDGGLPQLATYLDATNSLIGDHETGPDGTPLTMQTGTGNFYLHHDWIGSITDTTDNAGVNGWRNAYDPFGIRTQTKLVATAPTQPFGFTGATYDPYAPNRVNLRARDLDSPTGRFTRPDPIELRPAEPVEPDYTYAGNAPTHRTDPSGLCSARDRIESVGHMLTGNTGPSRCELQDQQKQQQGTGRFGPMINAAAGNLDDALLCAMVVSERYVWEHTTLGFGGCLYLCWGLTFQGGTISFGWGPFGIVEHGPSIGWSHLAARDRGSHSRGEQAALFIGGYDTYGIDDAGYPDPNDFEAGIYLTDSIGLSFGDWHSASYNLGNLSSDGSAIAGKTWGAVKGWLGLG